MAKRRTLPKQTKHQFPSNKKPPSWAAVRSLFTCKYLLQVENLRFDSKKIEETKKYKCSVSLCTKTEVSNSNLRNSQDTHKLNLMKGSMSVQRRTMSNSISSTRCSSSSSSTSVKTLHSTSSPCFVSVPFRKLSGCHECKMVVDPVLGMTRDPSLRNAVFPCLECGKMFMKSEHLELHHVVKHAVIELGRDDTTRNIVEIIFQSSWVKKHAPVSKIDRILKIQNTVGTIRKFEEYRDSIKAKATKLPNKHPRCIADGNELLRFHGVAIKCSLGLNGSSNLCSSIPSCTVCAIIKHGFRAISNFSSKCGILTTSTSVRAHERCRFVEDGNRAMLVCRVIAGRVKKSRDGSSEDYDSMSGMGAGAVTGSYLNSDELYVFNPRAILPCFVVIYNVC